MDKDIIERKEKRIEEKKDKKRGGIKAIYRRAAQRLRIIRELLYCLRCSDVLWL